MSNGEKVQRYTPLEYDYGMDENDAGEYVKYDDYAAHAATIVALKNEVANLQAWLADRDSALHAEPASQHAARDYLDFDSKLRLLQAAVTMTCNMLERDNKVVRTEAAELLRVAVAEFAEVASQPVPRAGRNASDNSAENPAAIRALASQPAAPVQPEREAVPGKSAVFAVDILGNPMREYAPGKWENCAWPSDAAPPVQQPGDVRENLSARNHVGAGLRWAEAIASEQIADRQALATTRPSAALTDERLNAEWLEAHRVWSASPDLGTPDRHIIFARAILAASSGAVAVPELPEGLHTAFDIVKRLHGTTRADISSDYYQSMAKIFRFVEDALAANVKATLAHVDAVLAAPATPAQGQTK